jgi:hypothetical protein
MKGEVRKQNQADGLEVPDNIDADVEERHEESCVVLIGILRERKG